MLRLGGGLPVVPLLVVLLTVLVRAPPVELWVLALPVMPKARALQVMPWWMVVFDRWGWDLATPGGVSHGRCWSVCWPWPPLVSLMPMVLYRVVSPWWPSWTLWVAVAEVALSVSGGVGDAGGEVVAEEGPYQDRTPLCPFRLSPLLTCSGSTIAFLKILKIQGPNPKI